MPAYDPSAVTSGGGKYSGVVILAPSASVDGGKLMLGAGVSLGSVRPAEPASSALPFYVKFSCQQMTAAHLYLQYVRLSQSRRNLGINQHTLCCTPEQRDTLQWTGDEMQ